MAAVTGACCAGPASSPDEIDQSSSRCVAVTTVLAASQCSTGVARGGAGWVTRGKVWHRVALPTIAKNFPDRERRGRSSGPTLAALSDMKLATYKDGSRDGQLVLVSRDLRLAHYATGAAHTMQQLLDDWNFIAPQLQDLYVALNQGRARHAFPFEPTRCMAPLPRAFQWLVSDADAAARSDALPPLRQGSGSGFAGPHDDMVLPGEGLRAESCAGLAVITGELPMRASPEQGLEAIRLLLLSNDWCLRAPRSADPLAEVGPVQAWPATAFGPVAVTLDELGSAWVRGRLEAVVELELNGRSLDRRETGSMRWHFGQLLSLACRTRPQGTGMVLGVGLGQPGRASAGQAQPERDCLSPGDRMRIEVRARDGQSLFGAIDQILSDGG